MDHTDYTKWGKRTTRLFKSLLHPNYRVHMYGEKFDQLKQRKHESNFLFCDWCFCYLIQRMHKIQQNNVVLGSGNVFLLRQCYAGILIECQYLNLSVFFYYFAFYSLGACQSLSSIYILLNSKRYSYSFYTFSLPY